jgi:hypothetical protein
MAQTFMVEIVRDTLADYQDRVRDEEAGGTKFSGNSVEVLDGHITNIATFEVLPPGQVIAEPTFVAAGQAPAGTAVLWTGVVLINNLNIAASMHR